MSPNTKFSAQHGQPQFYATKTELYLKVKKPLLERQRRARINKCLDALKTLVAEFQGDDAIIRMDKAEMLESTIAFMRQHSSRRGGDRSTKMPAVMPLAPMDSFRNGYMNAVNEVSRVMAAMPGMSVDVGKSVMTHLGSEFNRLLQQQQRQQQRQQQQTIVKDAEEKLCEKVSRPSSRASSGYHSDCEHDSPMSSPAPIAAITSTNWRPWL